MRLFVVDSYSSKLRCFRGLHGVLVVVVVVGPWAGQVR